MLLLQAFAIQVHFGACDRIRHDNDLRHLRFTLWLQSPCCSIDTEPILHQKQGKEEPSSRFHQNLFRSGTLVPLSAFLLYIFFFRFRQRSSRLVLCALPTKGFFCASLFSSVSSSCFSISFLSSFSEPATVLTGASKVLGSSPWLFFLRVYQRHHLGCFPFKVLGSLRWLFLSRVLGPFPDCFLQRFLGPFPDCFLFKAPLLPHCHPLPHP